jgi:hypothetical protein
VVRPVLASAAVVALTLPLAAQPGRGSMGGGFRDRPGVAPPSGFRILQAPAGYRPPGLARAQPYGFYPTYGFGGGFITGGYAPYYVVPPPVFLADPAPVGGGPVAPAGPSTVTAVSGRLLPAPSPRRSSLTRRGRVAGSDEAAPGARPLTAVTVDGPAGATGPPPTGAGSAAGRSRPAGPSTVTAVSGVLPATLVLQYPAAARVLEHERRREHAADRRHGGRPGRRDRPAADPAPVGGGPVAPAGPSTVTAVSVHSSSGSPFTSTPSTHTRAAAGYWSTSVAGARR